MDVEKDFFEEIIDGNPNQSDNDDEGRVVDEEDESEKKDEPTEDVTEENEGSKEDEKSSEEEAGTVDEEDLNNTDDLDDPQLILQRYKTLQGMYRSQKEKLEELSKKLDDIPEPKGNPEEGRQEPSEQQAEKQEQGSSDETVDTSWVSEALKENEKISELSEELPEIASLVEESLKSVMEKYTIAVSQAMQIMAQQIEQKVAPIEQTIGQTLKEKKLAKISEVHPDYSDYLNSQELSDWINSKPSRIKQAYEAILKEGEAEEVIELLNDFKQETQIVSNTKPVKKKTPKAVTTKTKSPSQGKVVDMNDFEQAFEEAIREE